MFDPVLLRSFVAVADTLSFTRASTLLGISQPTVSQQVRKLEKAAGRVLIARDTRAVTLTDNGSAMLGFARNILAAHDEAASYFLGSAMRGRLRFGAADDLALTHLPQVLRDFRQLYPQINLELTVGQSGALSRRLAAGQFDLVYVKQELGRGEGRLVRRERLVWVAHRSLRLEPDAPVPLILYQAPSLSRDVALHALEDAGRTWRITCNTREVSGALAALRAGIGIAVLPRVLIPDDLVEVTGTFELPRLVEVDFVLLSNPQSTPGAVEALANTIHAAAR
ncbi:LysR substrate-binding domain-containing protein [Protaetiibacter larvae]|uniref:LysR family transcriptional regulator n=1 Tax=Protaetiibacter larvae TaxID=2592654 RepID=A0A5C1Y774_9MICO|nr:LysR substrate-binding domain-containing protein [Protaetiibacter larvae]QEO09646.1 LysR family transcriptional regulator [Protaetiibacter larvae]